MSLVGAKLLTGKILTKWQGCRDLLQLEKLIVVNIYRFMTTIVGI